MIFVNTLVLFSHVQPLYYVILFSHDQRTTNTSVLWIWC